MPGPASLPSTWVYQAVEKATSAHLGRLFMAVWWYRLMLLPAPTRQERLGEGASARLDLGLMLQYTHISLLRCMTARMTMRRQGSSLPCGEAPA